MTSLTKIACIFLSFVLFTCQQSATYDTIIRNALIYDGSGNPPFKGEIAINADTIAGIA